MVAVAVRTLFRMFLMCLTVLKIMTTTTEAGTELFKGFFTKSLDTSDIVFNFTMMIMNGITSFTRRDIAMNSILLELVKRTVFIKRQLGQITIPEYIRSITC